MMKKGQVASLMIVVSVLISAVPISSMLYGQGQIQSNPVESLVELANGAEQEVENLIDLVFSNETVLQKIEDANLFNQLEGNVSLYGEGVQFLNMAYDSLEVSDYQKAVDYSTEALRIFRDVFMSIPVILETAGLQNGHSIDDQGLLEAISRELQRINQLRAIIQEDVPEGIKQMLNKAEGLLNIDTSIDLLAEGREAEVKSNLDEANQLLSQVYLYLKEQAEQSNNWRIFNYCQIVEERIRARFRAGNESGTDFTAVLESLGYQSESQFMETLQNMIQIAQGKTGDIAGALQDLEAISQMVQEMDQALAQEMQRHQGGAGPAGSNSGYGSTSSGVDGFSGGGNGP
jgi:hypothetical protein